MSTLARLRPAGQSEGRKPARPCHGTCRLSLSINGALYAVRPVEADASATLRAFRLRKSDGTIYHVADHPYGSECDCPDFIFHRDGLDPAGCKHIKALVACGILAPPADRPALALADEWLDWTDADRWTVA